MLTDIRSLLTFEMTIAEWIGTAVILLVPYLIVGVVWTVMNSERLGDASGLRWVVAVVVSVTQWPAMLVFGLYMS